VCHGDKRATYHKEEGKTRRILAVAVVTLGLITFVGGSVFWAETSALAQVGSEPKFAGGSHLAKAIEQLQAAIAEHGKPKSEPEFAVHLTEARWHAEVSRKEKGNPHLDAAIKEMNTALVDVEAKHADAATKAAKEALNHLTAVK